MSNNRPFYIANVVAWVLLIAAYMIYVTQVSHQYLWAIPAVTTLFAAMNFLFVRILKKADEKSPRRFITAFTGVIGIKLMVALIFTLLYLLLVKVENFTVVIGLFIAYMTFTIVLIRFTLKSRTESTESAS